MNGVFFELKTNSVTLVASDAQKMVRYRRKDLKSESDASFVLPKKPANLLKGILPKEQADVVVEFDNKNAMFTLTGYKMICRLTEGQFPNYEAVIPKDNPNQMTVDRVDLNTIIKRVAVFSNQASNLVKMSVKANELVVSAQDIDFSISAYERIKCQYEGEDIEIGFKSVFLNEILSNLESPDVLMEMSDPSRAGIFKPLENEDENEDILMLLMPMMINA
jgi:DNA polymerase-3 subunit beta